MSQPVFRSIEIEIFSLQKLWEEVAGAFVAALERQDGPSMLLLTRQKVPTLNAIDVDTRRRGVAQGAYIARRETAVLKTILLATGSELQHALAAAEELGPGTRVVSMPCSNVFDAQDEHYRASVLPADVTLRVAVEAGVTEGWWRYVGDKGRVIGLDRFGESAPAGELFEHFGFTAANVAATVRDAL